MQSNEKIIQIIDNIMDICEGRNSRDSYIYELEKSKNNAYWERNQLVAFLSKILSSHLSKHEDDPNWDEDWRNIVFLYLPNGSQISFHIHDSDLKYFSHLEYKENKWDGHSTEEKFRRMRAYENYK